MTAKEEKDDNPGTIPLAPENLARAYADVAMGFNRRLPELERKVENANARLDHVHGITLASHGLISSLTMRVEDIASKVGATRTTSPSAFPLAYSPPEPLEIHTVSSKTGSHQLIEHEELERLRVKWMEKEAEERGAKQALADLQTQQAFAEQQRAANEASDLARSKDRREKLTLALTILVAVFTLAGWAFGHITAHLTPTMVTAPSR